MVRYPGIIKIFAAACISFAALLDASQGHAATVGVIHGINGKEVSAHSSRELPVDIAVNGRCGLKGLTFGSQQNIELAPGAYRVTVHPSDGSCSQRALIDQNITVRGAEKGWSYSLIASLSAQGVPRLVLYDNNGAYGWGVAVAVRHLAYAPPLFARISVPGAPANMTRVTRMRNGDYGTAYTAWTDKIPYTVTVATSRTGKSVLRVQGTSRNTTSVWRIFHVVGSVKNGLRLVQQDISQKLLQP